MRDNEMTAEIGRGPGEDRAGQAKGYMDGFTWACEAAADRELRVVASYLDLAGGAGNLAKDSDYKALCAELLGGWDRVFSDDERILTANPTYLSSFFNGAMEAWAWEKAAAGKK